MPGRDNSAMFWMLMGDPPWVDQGQAAKLAVSNDSAVAPPVIR